MPSLLCVRCQEAGRSHCPEDPSLARCLDLRFLKPESRDISHGTSTSDSTRYQDNGLFLQLPGRLCCLLLLCTLHTGQRVPRPSYCSGEASVAMTKLNVFNAEIRKLAPLLRTYKSVCSLLMCEEGWDSILCVLGLFGDLHAELVSLSLAIGVKSQK